MNRLTLCIIMFFLILMVVGVEALQPILLAVWDLVHLCWATSIWGKVVLFICGVLTVVFFIGE